MVSFQPFVVNCFFHPERCAVLTKKHDTPLILPAIFVLTTFGLIIKTNVVTVDEYNLDVDAQNHNPLLP